MITGNIAGMKSGYVKGKKERREGERRDMYRYM